MPRKLKVAFTAAVAIALAFASSTVAHAATYFYQPGDPTYFAFPGNPSKACTGGYVIAGTDGVFFLTDGHCGPVARVVYGTDSRFGSIKYSRWMTADTALIKPDAGVDSYQIVVDPLSRRSPGRVVGIYPVSQLGVGAAVGKMGVATGWTEGEIIGNSTSFGMTTYCAITGTSDHWAGGGDSGGPVWRSDGAGHVWAVGIIVTYVPATGMGCFIPIETLLNNWGAYLPVFPMLTQLAVPRGSTVPSPHLNESDFIPAVGP